MLGDSFRRRQPRPRARHTSGRGPGLRFWLPAALLALIVPFTIGYVLPVFVFFPPKEVAPAGIPVPSLYGLSTLEAERTLAQAHLGSLEVTELPHPITPAGDVLAQSPLPGQQLRAGHNVRVAVSSGPVQVRVPDVLGQTAERADEALRQLGFAVARVDGESSVAAGLVYAIAPAIGTQASLPALVTIHVSLGPPPPDSLLLDSLPVILPDTVPGGR